MNRYLVLWVSVLGVTALPWASVGPAQAASFRGVGTAFNPRLGIVAMSDDGSTLVGHYEPLIDGNPEALRWTEAEGFVDLGFLGNGAIQSEVSDVSSDGSVIVGSSLWTDNRGWEAFRWSEAKGMVGLGHPTGGRDSFASCVSADGSTVIGWYKDQGENHAARWTEAEGWTTLPGANLSGNDISADASVIVGATGRGFLMEEAARWTQETGTVPLGYLHGPPTEPYEGSQASACSADGSVVVGWSQKHDVAFEAFRWTAETGMVGLGDLREADIGSRALGISPDGTIVVGHGSIGYAPDPARDAFRATIWDATHGLRDFQQLLIDEYSLGDELAGWGLTAARGISEDHKVIWGSGYNPADEYEYWVAEIPEPSSVALLGTAWIALLALARRRVRWERKR